ncbi:hypothetical protein ACFYOR_25820 [Streptomyces griseofuscus]|uniref:hypothetical protein n=1 Tax=Streptomyces griseofuscus TaxID=146922 RepID=UPI0036AFB3A3
MTVYLDQNAWVNLLKEAKKSPSGVNLKIQELMEYKSSGLAHFPLSAMHYMETWHRSKWESRYDLAGIMRDLSGYLTLAPIHRLQRAEIERATVEKMKLKGFIPVPEIGAFGHGVDHAFASSTGRFRYVESLADEHLDSPGIELEDDPIRILKSKGDAVYQWASLAGSPDSLELEGFDRITQHRRGRFYADNQQKKMDLWTSSGGKDLMDRAVITNDFIAALDDVNDVCNIRGVDPLSLVHSREDIMELWNAVPTLHTYSSLRIQRFRNAHQKWSQHDLADLLALSVAIPYCDVVVTERQWCHFAKQAKLNRAYDTLITPSLNVAMQRVKELATRK